MKKIILSVFLISAFQINFFAQYYGGVGIGIRSINVNTSQLSLIGAESEFYQKNQVDFHISGMASDGNGFVEPAFMFTRTTLLSQNSLLSWGRNSPNSSKVGYNHDVLRFDYSWNITHGDVFKLQLGMHSNWKVEGMNTLSGVVKDNSEEYIHHFDKFGGYGLGSGLYRTRHRIELGPSVGFGLFFEKLGIHYDYSIGLYSGGNYNMNQLVMYYNLIEDKLTLQFYARHMKHKIKEGKRHENEAVVYPEVRLKSYEFGVTLLTPLLLF